MSIGLLKNMLDTKPASVRLLGLDIGSKTIGLAVSDDKQALATPLQTIKRTKFAKDMKALSKVIQDFEIGGYVFGWPVNMDGSTGPRCDAVRSFADEFCKYPKIVGDDPWVSFWDERLSTETVEGFVDGFVDKKKAKAKGLTDKLAAQIILQGALDFMGAVCLDPLDETE